VCPGCTVHYIASGMGSTHAGAQAPTAHARVSLTAVGSFCSCKYSLSTSCSKERGALSSATFAAGLCLASGRTTKWWCCPLVQWCPERHVPSAVESQCHSLFDSAKLNKRATLACESIGSRWMTTDVDPGVPLIMPTAGALMMRMR
jgi:hypothetical protein